jgi:hypothetical protein
MPSAAFWACRPWTPGPGWAEEELAWRPGFTGRLDVVVPQRFGLFVDRVASPAEKGTVGVQNPLRPPACVVCFRARRYTLGPVRRCPCPDQDSRSARLTKDHRPVRADQPPRQCPAGEEPAWWHGLTGRLDSLSFIATLAYPGGTTKPHRNCFLEETFPPGGRNTFTRLHTLVRNMIGPPKECGERGGVSPPSLRQAGLPYHGKAVASGAQTERRGGAGPVRGLLGGKAPTGQFVSCQ